MAWSWLGFSYSQNTNKRGTQNRKSIWITTFGIRLLTLMPTSLFLATILCVGFKKLFKGFSKKIINDIDYNSACCLSSSMNVHFGGIKIELFHLFKLFLVLNLIFIFLYNFYFKSSWLQPLCQQHCPLRSLRRHLEVVLCCNRSSKHP